MLRRFLLDHRALAACVLGMALLIKALLPSGYMIGGAGGLVTIELCTGNGVQKIVTALPGLAHDQDASEQGEAAPCAFAGLATPMLAGADPLLLADAIAFILAVPFCTATQSSAATPTFLRPPLRGPPSRA